MIDPIYLNCNGRIVRAAITDDDIYFVFCDMCKFRGFRPASKKADIKPVYQRIKTLTGSTTVRLIDRDDMFLILSHMHHMEQYGDVELELYRWFRGRVLPCLYKRPDCKRFIPRGPWKKQWEEEIASKNDASLIISETTDAEKRRLHCWMAEQCKPKNHESCIEAKTSAEPENNIRPNNLMSTILLLNVIDLICAMPMNSKIKRNKTEKQSK